MIHMRTTPLLLSGLLMAALSTPPTATADGCPEGAICGRVPAGSNGAFAEGFDHHRHGIPPGVVGLVLPSAWVTGNEWPLAVAKLGRLTTCPPGAACTQVVDESPCLVAYASAGTLVAPYAFRWTKDASEAHVLLGDLPQVWGPSPPLGGHPTAC